MRASRRRRPAPQPRLRPENPGAWFELAYESDFMPKPGACGIFVLLKPKAARAARRYPSGTISRLAAICCDSQLLLFVSHFGLGGLRHAQVLLQRRQRLRSERLQVRIAAALRLLAEFVHVGPVV